MFLSRLLRGLSLPLMLLQASVTVTPFPDEVVGFANSMIYGFGLGFVLNWTAWMIGSLIVRSDSG